MLSLMSWMYVEYLATWKSLLKMVCTTTVTVIYLLSYCSIKPFQQIMCCLIICLFTTASQAKLKSLIKFWIGWEVPVTEMKVEIVEATLPTALTCFEKLRLPRHYNAYNTFHQDLCACISSSYSGFGCAWSGIMFTLNVCRLNVWNLPMIIIKPSLITCLSFPQ